jgi:uncharacterized protein
MKRILSLEGGGIRSLYTLQVLSKIEALLKERANDPNYRLCDHFDLIAGTSAGAIIASLLSSGMGVPEVIRNYNVCIQAVFKRTSWYNRFKHSYTDKFISAELKKLFLEEDGTDALRGTRKWKTLVLLVLRNATTGSPWPLTNNPNARFNDPSLPDCNLKIPLWQLIRASAAAPTFFPSETIQLGSQTFEFIDGGVSSYNNPSFLAYQTATLPEYNIGWETGAEKLFLLSVGACRARPELPKMLHKDMNRLDHAQHVIESLLYSSSIQQDLACRTVGKTLYGDEIDTEVQRRNAPEFPREPQFSYTSYNAELHNSDLKAFKKAGKQNKFSIDNLELIPFLEDLGRTYSEALVEPAHIL